MDRPNILYVIDDLGHGGAQRQLFLTARALADAADVTVVSLSDRVDPYAGRLREHGVPVVVIPRHGPLDLSRARSLADAVHRADAGLVHGFLDASNAYAFLAARADRLPVVLSLRSDRLHVSGPRAVALRWMLRRADAVTVNSTAGRDHLVRTLGVAEARVHLVSNIVEPAGVPAVAPPSPPLVGCVGRLVAVKRFEAVIAAMPAVRERCPGTRLVLLGEGPCRARLESAAARAGVREAVEFAGAVEDAGARIAGLSCLVVASEHEGLTNAALEALAAGVAVVAVPAGDLPRVVTDGVTGVTARDGSPPSLAAAIVRALTSESLLASARREGPRLVRERFSADLARRELLGLYRRLLSAPQ